MRPDARVLMKSLEELSELAIAFKDKTVVIAEEEKDMQEDCLSFGPKDVSTNLLEAAQDVGKKKRGGPKAAARAAGSGSGPVVKAELGQSSTALQYDVGKKKDNTLDVEKILWGATLGSSIAGVRNLDCDRDPHAQHHSILGPQ